MVRVMIAFKRTLFGLALGASLSLSACDSDTPELDALKSKMCACEDSDCAVKVLKEMRTKAEAIKAEAKKSDAKTRKLQEEINVCLKKHK